MEKKSGIDSAYIPPLYSRTEVYGGSLGEYGLIPSSNPPVYNDPLSSSVTQITGGNMNVTAGGVSVSGTLSPPSSYSDKALPPIPTTTTASNTPTVPVLSLTSTTTTSNINTSPPPLPNTTTPTVSILPISTQAHTTHHSSPAHPPTNTSHFPLIHALHSSSTASNTVSYLDPDDDDFISPLHAQLLFQAQAEVAAGRPSNLITPLPLPLISTNASTASKSGNPSAVSTPRNDPTLTTTGGIDTHRSAAAAAHPPTLPPPTYATAVSGVAAIHTTPLTSPVGATNKQGAFFSSSSSSEPPPQQQQQPPPLSIHTSPLPPPPQFQSTSGNNSARPSTPSNRGALPNLPTTSTYPSNAPIETSSSRSAAAAAAPPPFTYDTSIDINSPSQKPTSSVIIMTPNATSSSSTNAAYIPDNNDINHVTFSTIPSGQNSDHILNSSKDFYDDNINDSIKSNITPVKPPKPPRRNSKASSVASNSSEPDPFGTYQCVVCILQISVCVVVLVYILLCICVIYSLSVYYPVCMIVTYML